MVTFNFTYDPGVTVQQALGFEIAGRLWSHFLSDPVTLNLHVGMSSSLPKNVIGGALPGILSNTSYETFRDQLQQDATSNSDRSVELPTGSSFASSFELVVEGLHASTLDKQFFTTNTLNVTRAGGKAVGLIPGNATALDGAIVMGNLTNSRFHWNYDFTRNTTVPTDSLDFLSVAIHEIGHLLGFVSGVDKPGIMANAFWEDGTSGYWADPATPLPTISGYWQNASERMAYVTPLDLFRVDNEGHRSMTYGSVFSDRKGFSPQSGSPAIAFFSQGKNKGAFGDGYQASHWREQATALGIMDPAIAPRERSSISNLDLQAFDAIGWNLRNGLNASTFTTAFLNVLHSQAASALATRLGQTTSWINSNLTVVPTNLGHDRTADVETMIRNSLIYEWGTTGSGATSIRGRRWMEIFNQMASNQEVYVNFSTVSQVAPPPAMMTSTELEQGSSQSSSDRPLAPGEASVGIDERAWEAIGSGGNDDRRPPHSWSIPTGQHSDSDKDSLSGVESVNPLVGNGVFDSFDPGATPSVGLPMTTSAAPMATWAPIVTWMAEGTAASVLPLTTSSGSRQQTENIAGSDPNTLLGHENNPLVQNSLSVGLMGAIA